MESHLNEFVELNFKDLKTLEIEVEQGASEVEVCFTIESSITGEQSCGNIGKEAIVTLKIKTKTGVVVNNRFSTAGGRNNLCMALSLSFVSKLTGKEVIRGYGFPNLDWGNYSVTTVGSRGSNSGCIFKKGETKAISSIVFKDGIKKKLKRS